MPLGTPRRPVYLDCAATTPLDPRVREVMYRYFEEEFGNAGSRTHGYGTAAKRAVQQAREQVAAVVNAEPDEVIFTSGATESNNLAILGLEGYGRAEARLHIVSTGLEHKAVLEPVERLRARGFEVTLLEPTRGGWVEPEAVVSALRPDTLMVSVMTVNNETGVIQPLAEIAEAVADHPAYLHTDAAQGFGRKIASLGLARVDLISISGHKIYGPKGVGALVMRRRRFARPPLEPLMVGGGQERGLRPGTMPVALVAALGRAAELAMQEASERNRKCAEFKGRLLEALRPLRPSVHGDMERAVPHVINLSFPGLDSEAVMVGLKDEVAISNGSACTSHSYESSHVLRAMGIEDDVIRCALRWSWSHLTQEPCWSEIATRLAALW